MNVNIKNGEEVKLLVCDICSGTEWNFIDKGEIFPTPDDYEDGSTLICISCSNTVPLVQREIEDLRKGDTVNNPVEDTEDYYKCAKCSCGWFAFTESGGLACQDCGEPKPPAKDEAADFA